MKKDVRIRNEIKYGKFIAFVRENVWNWLSLALENSLVTNKRRIQRYHHMNS